MNMILSFLVVLLLFGNGALGFQTSRSATAIHFPESFPSLLSPTKTDQKDSPAIQNVPRLQSRSLEGMQRRASQTSFSLTDSLPSSQKSLRDVWHSVGERYPWLCVGASQVVTTQAVLSKLVSKSWWISPMILAIVPLYCAVFQGTSASMPAWWPMVKMDTIRQSKDAVLVIGGFLLSNIAYFVSGGYLLKKFPFKTVEKGLIRVTPTKFTFLGMWILTAGMVSTIFHSVQALGSHALAESLCYVDHGIAISAGGYFLKTCGLPSRKVLALGCAALVTLVMTDPGYTLLHSIWHFLSAVVATKWAVEGYNRLE